MQNQRNCFTIALRSDFWIVSEEVNDSLGTIRQWGRLTARLTSKIAPCVSLLFDKRRLWKYRVAARRRQHYREGTERGDEYTRARVETIFANVTQNGFRTPLRVQGSVPCATCGFWMVPERLFVLSKRNYRVQLLLMWLINEVKLILHRTGKNLNCKNKYILCYDQC